MNVDIFKEIEEKKVVVSIFRNKYELHKFSAGYIVKVSKDYYVMARISPTGCYDGFGIGRIEDVYRLGLDGEYEKKLNILYHRRNQSHSEFNIENYNLMEAFLEFAKINRYIVTIELLESNCKDVQGFVDNIIKNNIITIKCVSEYGEVDGITYLKKEDISSILCDSEDEVVLKILSENVLSPNKHW